ncbi:MAG: nucleotidyltransferase [Candidatus Omnitrophota bacterium]
MSMQIQKMMAEEIGGSIDIPDSSYEAAQKRYGDLGKWLKESLKSKSAQFKPHVFSQGSFRLGTVIKPLGMNDYDLDLSCKLQQGITKENYTQEQLKELLGADLEAYRLERHIEEKLERRHRCWRLYYQDGLKFHIDTVPCIPEIDHVRQILQERMIEAGEAKFLAEQVAQLAVSITDDRKPSYRVISPDWNISNPEGYAQWFVNQMKQAGRFLESMAINAKVAKVDDLPVYKWRTPLQRCVQILKRHRDIMFESNNDGKPISIIITTLAARAYRGEDNIETAMQGVLSQMGGFVKEQQPRVPNPVNPIEDFADKWRTEEGRRLRLEENFWRWLNQAKADFGALGSSGDIKYLVEQASEKFGTRLNSDELKIKLGSVASISAVGKGLADQTPKRPVDLRGGGRLG